MSGGRPIEIIATIGPASASAETLAGLAAAGATGLRLNLAHATSAWLTEMLPRIREIKSQTGRPLEIIADLPGRKLRTGQLEQPFQLEPGMRVGVGTSATDNFAEATIPLLLPPGGNWPPVGAEIKLKDGRIVLEVIEPADKGVRCRVVQSGEATSRMGINLPGILSNELIPVDLLRLCFTAGTRSLLISYCESRADIDTVADLCRQLEAPECRLIPKIETPLALENLAALLDAGESLCLARGDLGTYLTPPHLAKTEVDLLAAARAKRRRVIVAGEVLPSFYSGGVPTRPEATAIYYALDHGAAGFILSDETATGPHPVEAVKLLADIAGTCVNPFQEIYEILKKPSQTDDYLDDIRGR